MTVYATQQDIISRRGIDALLAVADRQHTGVPDAVAVSQALADASTQMDGYMSERFDLPFATVPTWATRICVDIAMYLLADSGAAITDDTQRRYDGAVQFMRDVSMGRVGLGLPPGEMPETGELGDVKGGDILIQSSPRRFGTRRIG